MLFNINELNDLSKEEIIKKIELMNKFLIKPYLNSDFNEHYTLFWVNGLDNEFNDNPYITEIIIDPIKEMEEGFNESILLKKCTCKGFRFKKGTIDCRHIKDSLKLIKLNRNE